MSLHLVRQAIWTDIWKHSGEKSNKCNECDFASAQADNLRIHVIMNPQISWISHMHCICLIFLSTEEKSQTNASYATFLISWPGNLIKHLKMQSFKGAPQYKYSPRPSDNTHLWLMRQNNKYIIWGLVKKIRNFHSSRRDKPPSSSSFPCDQCDYTYGRKSADRTKPHFGVMFFVFLSMFLSNL